jgi:dTDP-4-amino-4,6-dideoxygalactose transaminase
MTRPASVPLFDISRQHAELDADIQAALVRVCRSGKFVLGPEVVELETAFAAYSGVKYAVACASGSDALLLGLMAYDVGPGDEVICPSYTFFATASAVTRLGAKPVFVDIDPATSNLDAAKVAGLVTRQTKAIIPVHLYGQTAEMEPLLYVARKHELPLIEDACQAVGAEYRGRRAGSLGNIGCFSFYPTKNLGAYGDGGMLTTDDAQLAEKLKLLRGHGMQPRYYHQVVGINSRLDTMQAAILLLKLPRLDAWTAARQERAARYDAWFREAGLDQHLRLPESKKDRRHVWNQYIVHVGDGRRNSLREHLSSRKIGTEIYYPVPLHRQECFAYLGYGPGSLVHTETAARETLALPIFPELAIDEQRAVVDEIKDFYSAGSGKIAA